MDAAQYCGRILELFGNDFRSYPWICNFRKFSLFTRLSLGSTHWVVPRVIVERYYESDRTAKTLNLRAYEICFNEMSFLNLHAPLRFQDSGLFHSLGTFMESMAFEFKRKFRSQKKDFASDWNTINVFVRPLSQ